MTRRRLDLPLLLAAIVGLLLVLQVAALPMRRREAVVEVEATEIEIVEDLSAEVGSEGEAELDEEIEAALAEEDEEEEND